MLWCGNIYDGFWADPNVKPNACLGATEKPPFFAARVWPDGLGTTGSLLTDDASRVIDQSDQPIPGLYAAGNSTSSVMERMYPGPGVTLGPAFMFAFIAVNHMAGQGT